MITGVEIDKWGHFVVKHDEDNPIDNREGLVYNQYPRFFIAEQDGYISALAHSGSDENEGGMYGRSTIIKMADGSDRKLTGWWQSNSKAINENTPYEVMECSHNIPRYKLTNFAGWVTVAKARELVAEFMPDHEVRVDDRGWWRVMPK